MFRSPSRHIRAIVPMLVAVVVASCATGPREIVTPEGARSADQTGPFVILGVVSRNTSTLRQSNANPPFEETVTVNVPPGTQMIIPAVRGWATGYGSTTPEDLSMPPDPDTFLRWRHTDEHFGLTWFNVYVDRINAVDSSTTPATQTAVIKVTAILGDENLDNEWWAWVNYNLICLGPHP